MGEDVKLSIDGHVATVLIHRPAQRNALSIRANQELFGCWEAVDADERIRAVVLTSSDCGTFCAGMDLKEAARVKAEQGRDILELLKDPMLQRLRSVRKPVIAAMTGHFTAGGMVLALNADLRVGLAGSMGGITEARLGRGSPWAVPLLWMLPQPVLMEMVLTGSLMPIERLADFGFVNYVESTPDAVRTRAHALATVIAANAPLSVAAGKASLLAGMALGSRAGYDEARRLHAAVYASEDAQEGPRAFAEKRTPVWRGR